MTAVKRIIHIIVATSHLYYVGSAKEISVNLERNNIRPILENYCVKCHGQEKQKGDITLHDIHWEITNNVSAQDWQDILDVIHSGEMPPEDEKQLSDAEFTIISSELSEKLTLARKRLEETGGTYTMRRINQREYVNNIKHLFGFYIPKAILPDDIRDEHHFDTSEKLQYFDPHLLEQYIRIGKQVATEGFEWSGKQYGEVKVIRTDLGKRTGSQRFIDLPKYNEGYYLYRGDRKNRTIEIKYGKDPRAQYLIRLRGGVVNPNDKQRHFLQVNAGGGIKGIMSVGGTVDSPEISELMMPLSTRGMKNHKSPFHLSETIPKSILNITRWYPPYLKSIGSDKKSPNVWVDWVEIEGPYYDQKHNMFGTLINEHGKDENTFKARELIQDFAYEAFRKTSPNLEYINNLVKYYQGRIRDGIAYEEAMSETIGLILSSPKFLYIEEREDPAKKGHLNPESFANRLSHFLWSSPPDEQLHTLARSGKLLNESYLKKEINRMLADSKAGAFYEGFMSQWAELERLGQVSVDWQVYPNHNAGIGYAAYREPIEFFKTLVQENLSIDNLISSNFLVINGQLARFYGIDKEATYNDFRKIELSPDSVRGGILTQSAFLAMGSVGNRTSPVIRGTLILEKLLNNPPPPPPPNVPELGETASEPLSNREMVKLHREQKTCASCHDKIDPIGFGLEHFDPIGQWRDYEIVQGKTFPVESYAHFPSGIGVDNHQELIELLMTQKKQLAHQMVNSLLSYGIGRNVEFADERDVDHIVDKAEKNNFTMGDLIYLVVNSKTFRSKSGAGN